jgi:hypothetical protein
LKNYRLVYLWSLLITGIYSIAILHNIRSIYHFVAAYDSNRWIHFLAYALVAAIPVAASRRKSIVLSSLVAAIAGIAFESFQAGIPWPIVSTQTVPADLFGVAAGILLGLNLRVMRDSGKSLGRAGADPSHSGIEKGQLFSAD